MRPINLPIKIAQQEVGVSTQIPLTHFNSPTQVESSSGSLLSVITFSGVPFDTAEIETLNYYKQIWHRALMALDDRFCLLGTIHRHHIIPRLSGTLINDYAKKVDAAYQAQFKERTLYVNDLYLAIIYKGLESQKIYHPLRWIKKASVNSIRLARQVYRDQHSANFNETILQLMTTLSDFKPRLLGETDVVSGYSELLTYLSLVVNGGEPLMLRSTAYATPMATSFKKTQRAILRYPKGNIAQYLTEKRLFFGDYIQFQGANRDDKRFAAMVSIKRYANETMSIMLDSMLQSDAEWISTQSFAIANKAQADQRMKCHIRKMKNVDDPATSQILSLSEARDSLACDDMIMGYHHNTIMLFGESKDAVDNHVATVVKCYSNAGFIAVRETIGQEPAFWSQIPGNQKHIARMSLISSQNFVDLFPLHNYQTGFQSGNHLGGALTLIETPSKTPLWFNLHAKGPKKNPSPGHTTIVGGNGCGKTVMLCFLDAQLNRYGGRSFFFDRNRGAEIYIRASQGYYTILSPNYPEDCQFNPLQLTDTAINRQFCKHWLVTLIKDEGEVSVDENTAQHLHDCIDYGYDHLAPQHRTLSAITQLLPVNFNRWSNLRRWLRGNNTRCDGEYAYLFDNKVDALTMHRKMGFDMTHFLDHESEGVLTSVMMYLFHRLEQTLEQGGELVSVFLDEAWQYLNNPYWQHKLKKWLPTLRKLNCHLIFATQSPYSVANSPISHTIFDNCATQIYFANPQAKASDYQAGFNLTEAEFSFVRNADPQSRFFLYKQGHDSAQGILNLSNLSEVLCVMSGTQETVKLQERIRKEVGDDPNVWLPIFIERVIKK